MHASAGWNRRLRHRGERALPLTDEALHPDGTKCRRRLVEETPRARRVTRLGIPIAPGSHRDELVLYDALGSVDLAGGALISPRSGSPLWVQTV